MKNIGENIKMIRRAKGMTQDELATTLGYTKSFLSLVESGFRTLSSVDIERVATALGASVMDLQSLSVSVHFRSSNVSVFEQEKFQDDFLKYARKFNKKDI